ncbi:hypothetical protein QCA50_001352 [Cerrena zonata]|uniref:Uncharacterized protein n=1 Tax=Cerrena zonata TaxID=2478898 RepID=A0AAW0GQH1_9APHY
MDVSEDGSVIFLRQAFVTERWSSMLTSNKLSSEVEQRVVNVGAPVFNVRRPTPIDHGELAGLGRETNIEQTISMPPKPRPRKSSTATKDDDSLPKTHNAHVMPPPPDPPQGILVPEMTALSTCMQNMAVKTGQIYAFFTDAQRLGIHKHTPNPPRSLTASLGREIEKYDQLCDALESHLGRVMTILQRDLERERERIREEERLKAEAIRKEMEASAPPSASPITSPLSSTIELQMSPVERKPLIAPSRRASTISLSSLHRTPFPHKLDLSSIAFNPEDTIPLHSGQASPVTLAPKSSILRASMPPPDLLTVGGQTVDIDLTLDDDDVAMTIGNAGDPSLGTSVDKPIELDLDDLDDLFTDTNQPMSSSNMGPGDGTQSGDTQMTDIFQVLQTGSDANKPSGSNNPDTMSAPDFSGMEQLMQSADSQGHMFPGTQPQGSEQVGTSTNDDTLNLQLEDFTNLTVPQDFQGLFNMDTSDNFAGSSSGAT